MLLAEELKYLTRNAYQESINAAKDRFLFTLKEKARYGYKSVTHHLNVTNTAFYTINGIYERMPEIYYKEHIISYLKSEGFSIEYTTIDPQIIEHKTPKLFWFGYDINKTLIPGYTLIKISWEDDNEK